MAESLRRVRNEANVLLRKTQKLSHRVLKGEWDFDCDAGREHCEAHYCGLEQCCEMIRDLAGYLLDREPATPGATAPGDDEQDEPKS